MAREKGNYRLRKDEDREEKKLEREMLAVLGEKEGYEMFFVGIASPSQLNKAILG